MPIIVEDGTIVANANVYTTRSFGDSYAKDRALQAWLDASGSEKDSGLIVGTQFIDVSWSFRGSRVDLDQSLKWPRIGAVDDEGEERDSDSIPLEIQRATVELAVLSFSGPLLPQQQRGGLIKKVKAGSVEVEYADHAPGQTTYDYIERIIHELIEGSTGGVTVDIFRA